MRGTLVRFLVWEDPTCCRAAEPMLWSLRTTTAEAHVLQSLCSATRETTTMKSLHITAGEGPHTARKPKLNKMLKILICLFGRVLRCIQDLQLQHVGSSSLIRLGIEPGSPALGVWSLSHRTTMEVPCPLFLSRSV